jgi:cell division septal protein FtsQ
MVWLRREKDQENRLKRRKIDSSRYGVLDAELPDIKPRRLRIKYIMIIMMMMLLMMIVMMVMMMMMMFTTQLSLL